MNFAERLIWAFRCAILDINGETFCIEDGLESGVREMTVGDAVTHLSNLIWPDTSDPLQANPRTNGKLGSKSVLRGSCEKICATTIAENLPAQKLLEKNGFPKTSSDAMPLMMAYIYLETEDTIIHTRRLVEYALKKLRREG